MTRTPTGIDSIVLLPMSRRRKKTQSVVLWVRIQLWVEDREVCCSLQNDQDCEKEPSLMRREKVHETASRVVQEKVQCFVQLGFPRNQLGGNPSKRGME